VSLISLISFDQFEHGTKTTTREIGVGEGDGTGNVFPSTRLHLRYFFLSAWVY
jgi:hypothetical protein